MSGSSKQAPKARDVWWAQAGRKTRLCIVLAYDDDARLFEIVYGQSVHDDTVSDQCVRLGSFDGNVLTVKNDTYFRVTNVEFLHAAAFERFVSKCPAGLFMRIEKMLALSKIATKPSEE